MGEDAKAIIAIFTAIIGVAIVSVLVSRNANTVGVIGAATAGFAQDLAVAVGPVTGQGFTSNTLSGLATGASGALLGNGGGLGGLGSTF